MAAQVSNQFSQTPLKGMIDMKPSNGVMQAQVDVSSAGSLLPGQAVKVVDSAGGVPKVVECAADSDEVWGFIAYDQIRSSFDAYDPVTVAILNGGAVMWMEASAAIARNAVVTIVVTGSKVKTSAGGSRDVGRALDKASANLELIRVILLPKTTVTA